MIRRSFSAPAAIMLAACGATRSTAVQRTSDGNGASAGQSRADGSPGTGGDAVAGGRGGAAGMVARAGRTSDGGLHATGGRATGGSGAVAGAGGLSASGGAAAASGGAISGTGGIACAAHFADCDHQPDNGCERDLWTDTKNCGACGLDCGTNSCGNGGCYCVANPVPLEATPDPGCEYAAPAPTGIGYLAMNVVLTPPGGLPLALPLVPDAAGCDPTQGGWYFDDRSAPTLVRLCDVTCAALRSSPGATVEALFRCSFD